MKKELLSPAGNFQTLKQVIHNGCDAVYLGGKKFGARKFADNFDNDEMIKAIKYCHLYGVKIYVTVNTMIYENEIEEVIDYIRFLHKNKVDALIMQDIGLIRRVRSIFPNLEIHASTQLHTHNDEQIKLLKELGVSRIVVAREMSIDDINNLTTDLEIEAFVHGALCVCYSGQCLFSSLLLNRSGNRGECAGICRLPFELFENDKKVSAQGKYLLSTKELCTLDHVKELMESNITSFKIEGRMKNSTTIGFITRLYRMMIDKYYNNEDLIVTDEDYEKLKLLFNREFTKGYLFNDYGSELMNIKSPNHVGIEIGEVIDINKDKIKIRLSKPVNQLDGIRFMNEDKGMILNYLYNEKNLLVNHAKKDEIVFVDNKINLKELTKVNKTIDSKQIKELEELKEKKIAINMFAKASFNGFSLEITDGINVVRKDAKIVEEAINSSTTCERIKEQLEKLGNTPFKLDKIKLDIDNNLFIPIKEINEIRRDLINELIYIRENSGKTFVEKKDNINYQLIKQDKINLNVLVRTEEQLKACIDNNVDNIYITNIKLYESYKKDNIYLRLDRVNKKHKEYINENLLITEIGGIFYAKNNNVISDYYLNVANSDYIDYLNSKNVKRITLSIENIKDHFPFNTSLENCEIIIYGKPEVMIMKYCPLNMLINNSKFPCNLCKQNNNYYLKDRNNELYPLLHENEITHIFNYRNINDADIKVYLENGIKNYRVELFDEDYINTVNTIKNTKNLLSNNK